MWKWIRHPKRSAKEHAMQKILVGLIRHLLTFGGGAFVLSDDEVQAVAGGLAALIGALWSVYEKKSKPAPATS